MSANNDQRSQHVIQKPIWMSVYKVIGMDQFDDPLTHFVILFYYDHITFEDAIKEIKCQKAMGDKIDINKKNNISKVTKLLKKTKDHSCKIDIHDKIKRKFFIDKRSVKNITLREETLDTSYNPSIYM
jgi:hypothetical protein